MALGLEVLGSGIWVLRVDWRERALHAIPGRSQGPAHAGITPGHEGARLVVWGTLLVATGLFFLVGAGVP